MCRVDTNIPLSTMLPMLVLCYEFQIREIGTVYNNSMILDLALIDGYYLILSEYLGSSLPLVLSQTLSDPWDSIFQRRLNYIQTDIIHRT